MHYGAALTMYNKSCIASIRKCILAMASRTCAKLCGWGYPYLLVTSKQIIGTLERSPVTSYPNRKDGDFWCLCLLSLTISVMCKHAKIMLFRLNRLKDPSERNMNINHHRLNRELRIPRDAIQKLFLAI